MAITPAQRNRMNVKDAMRVMGVSDLVQAAVNPHLPAWARKMYAIENQRRRYRDWRDRANAHLSTQSNVDAWADSHVLAALRHTAAGHVLWMEARDLNFFEDYHLSLQER